MEKKKKMKKEARDREEGKLNKVKVLKKFTGIFGLKVLKIPPLSSEGGAVWKLVKELDGMICPLYSPQFREICAQGPRTDILYFLFNAIPWWYERWYERRSCKFSEKKVDNPVFGCKSLEEAWLKLDLLQEDGNENDDEEEI